MAATSKKKWSGRVTATSDAMDVASGTFKQRSAKKIAETVERDAERSTRRKASPYASAMSMLSFYLNRGGKNLSPRQREIIEHAKEILRQEFGPDSKPAKKSVAKKSVAKKSAAKKSAAKKSAAKRSSVKSPAKKATAKKAVAKKSAAKSPAKKSATKRRAKTT